MKLISDLQVGDKVFVIIKSSWTLDVAEVIESKMYHLKFQLYLNTVLFSSTFYMWKHPTTKLDTPYWIIFTDENEAITTFKEGLDGRNR